MKIATCLSGHSRNYLYNHPNFPFETDYFISSCWQSGIPNENTEEFVSYHTQNNVETDMVNINEIVNLYKPNLYEFLNDKELPKELIKFDNHRTLSGGILIHIGLMFYRIYRANLLKKEYELLNNFKYDLVIRSRFDIKVVSANLDRNKLNMVFDGNSICDLFFAGSSHIMDIVSECYLWFVKQDPRYLSSFKNAETILLHYIEYLKLDLMYSNDFDIIFNKDYPKFNYVHIKNGLTTYEN